MPNFYKDRGVKINVYSGDHPPPHVHAIHNDEEAVIDIQTLAIITGSLPARELRIALDLVISNQENLLATFNQLNERLNRNG